MKIKNIETGGHYCIEDGLLVEELTAVKSLNSTYEKYQLDCLETIISTTKLDEVKARNKAEHSERKKSNIVTGAILGGLIDASSGEDSILNGILLGAAFGALMTGSEKEPVAKIVLVFKDGCTLSVECDEDAYSVFTSYANKPSSRSVSLEVVKLSDSEKDMILSLRQSKDTQMHLTWYVLAAVWTAMATLIIDINALEAVTDSMESILPIGLAVFVGWIVIGSIMAVLRPREKSEFIKDGESSAHNPTET